MKINKEIVATAIILSMAVLIVFCIILGFILESKNAEKIHMMPMQNDENRFDVEHIEALSIPERRYAHVGIITDRETDVQYIIVYDKKGIGISTMRDKGGTVLLRE